MGKISAIGPGTETGKQILDDFKRWRVTGFKPWGNGVGGVNHYNSSHKYKVVSASAFRSQARKIAKFALEQMSQSEVEESFDDEANDRNIETEDDTNLLVDSERRNPWIRSENIAGGQDCDDNDDGENSCKDGNSSIDDSPQDFRGIKFGEHQNSREPFLSEYPTMEKLLAIFPLDGNVLDTDAIFFEFIQDNTAIQRWGKVPKERESSLSLIGLGTETWSNFGSDIDVLLVHAEIQRRLKANDYKRDEKGDIWEIRATLQLPFKCNTQFYDKNGKLLKKFRIQSNGRGFSWVFFWLLAWNPPKPKPAKRIGGKLVKIMTKDESSVYTEKTYESSRSKK